MQTSRNIFKPSISGSFGANDVQGAGPLQSVEDRAPKAFFACFFAGSTVNRAIKVAFVVGPILGFINHFDLLLGANLTSMRVVKIAVTFLVPFCVSAYSSATTMIGQGEPSTPHLVDTSPRNLDCVSQHDGAL